MSNEEQGRDPSTQRGISRDVEAQNLLQPSSDPNGETNNERRDQIRHLEKEAFQLANYYFVFQGVIFTAFYNTPSHLKCEYRWVPFALSFLAGFLNLCTLLKIVLSYMSTLDDIDKLSPRRASDNHTPSSESSGTSDDEPIAVKCASHWRRFYAIGSMCVVIAFFVITLIGCWTISCGGNNPNAAAAPPSPATT